MKFHVTGVDAKTGETRVLHVIADCEKDALVKAKSEGVFTSRIKPMLEPPSTIKMKSTNQAPISSQRYTYKTVQMPPTIVVKAQQGSEAAVYLENVINSHAKQGWEFYRVDSFGVQVQPGCLGFLLGEKAVNHMYYVVTFRMEIGSD